MLIFATLSLSYAAEYASLYSLSDMNTLSSRIVQAEIINKTSYVQNGKIYSTIRLQVEQTFTGITENELEIDVLGGTVDGLEMHVSGLPSFQVGMRSLFFLDHDRILGFGQGVYSIDDNIAQRHPSSGLPEQNIELTALPNESKSEECLAPVIDTHYAQGWSLKNVYSHHTLTQTSNIFPFTAYEDLSYKILVCSDGNMKTGSLTLKSESGEDVLQEMFSERNGSLSFTANDSSLYLLDITSGQLRNRSISSGFTVAILYRE
jgi:hypothetical protein